MWDFLITFIIFYIPIYVYLSETINKQIIAWTHCTKDLQLNPLVMNGLSFVFFHFRDILNFYFSMKFLQANK